MYIFVRKVLKQNSISLIFTSICIKIWWTLYQGKPSSPYCTNLFRFGFYDPKLWQKLAPQHRIIFFKSSENITFMFARGKWDPFPGWGSMMAYSNRCPFLSRAKNRSPWKHDASHSLNGNTHSFEPWKMCEYISKHISYMNFRPIACVYACERQGFYRKKHHKGCAQWWPLKDLVRGHEREAWKKNVNWLLENFTPEFLLFVSFSSHSKWVITRKSSQKKKITIAKI